MPASPTETLARYRWAADYINNLIQGPPTPPADATPEEIRARALARLDHLRSFLASIGAPQTTYRTAHVAGTSGKGSTSAYLASILQAAGYRTGLHISPYLQVETEKLQVNGRLLSAFRFADYVEELVDAANRWGQQTGEHLTYGSFWVALTYLALSREQVDIAVIEVGAGGRFDVTNVIQPDVAVITSIGIDHTRSLGGTIPEIAWHKAGIIKPGRPAVTTVDDPAALAVIEQEAAEQGAALAVVAEGRDYRVLGTGPDGTELLDIPSGRVFHLPLPGTFQGANAAAAIAAARALRDLPGGPISDDAMADGLARTRFPGRMEIVQRSPLVLLDGAHNPDKMRSLRESLDRINRPQRRLLVFGCLDSHDYLEVARIIAPATDEVIVTAPKAYERASAPPETLAAEFRAAGKPVEIIDAPSAAIAAALNRAETDDQIIVTGSLYLVGQVRERWYHSDDIIRACTSFPGEEGTA